MTNLEFYKDKLLQFDYLGNAASFADNRNMKEDKDKTTYQNFIIWLSQEYEPLDRTEKRYLSDLIRPFRKDVRYISKEKYENGECIKIAVYSEPEDEEYIYLPTFKCLDMYRGMKPEREYTLEELKL